MVIVSQKYEGNQSSKKMIRGEGKEGDEGWMLQRGWTEGRALNPGPGTSRVAKSITREGPYIFKNSTEKKSVQILLLTVAL